MLCVEKCILPKTQFNFSLCFSCFVLVDDDDEKEAETMTKTICDRREFLSTFFVRVEIYGNIKELNERRGQKRIG